jgi:ADP-heptose:LPS heptosyltransferase
LITLIDKPIIHVGVEGEEQLVEDFRTNLPLNELSKLIMECDTWIGVDSFFQHLCWDLNKPGIVLWGQSDPNIFGHPENINLLKDREYLMKNQFLMWELVPYRKDCFVDPNEVIQFL